MLYAVYDGLYYHEGDCYTVYATAAYLLDQCGIENKGVTRSVQGGVTHYWSLVNIGSGWYHFDASHHDPHWKCFMQTDEQVRTYSQEQYGYPDYYSFDEEDMPECSEMIVFSN